MTPEYQILCEYNHSFVPINGSNANPGINANNEEANYDKNEEDDDEEDVKNNDATFNDEYGGIIMNDFPIEYDEFNITITMVHFRMCVRHTVFGFYRQISRPFKKHRKKLVIIYVLCYKALDSTNYYQWTWLKCARVITNNTTNLLWHLDNKDSGVASVEAMVSNNNNKGSV